MQVWIEAIHQIVLGQQTILNGTMVPQIMAVIWIIQTIHQELIAIPTILYQKTIAL